MSTNAQEALFTKRKNEAGLLCYMECDSQGNILDQKGNPSENFSHTISSFIKQSKHIGDSLGLGGFLEVSLHTDDKTTAFSCHRKKVVGIEFCH